MAHEKDGYENMEQKLTSLNFTKDIEIKNLKKFLVETAK